MSYRKVTLKGDSYVSNPSLVAVYETAKEFLDCGADFVLIGDECYGWVKVVSFNGLCQARRTSFNWLRKNKSEVQYFSVIGYKVLEENPVTKEFQFCRVNGKLEIAPEVVGLRTHQVGSQIFEVVWED